MVPDTTKSIPLFEVSRASPACPSDKSSIKTKTNMEHLWIDTDRGKPT
jgi:hypothetical protein